jgi:hypothetical protein
MGLFSKKEKRELMAVFDVGSSGVGGALFWKDGASSPEIIFSVREDIPFQESFDFSRFLLLTLKALENVAKKISLSGLGAPKKIYCVLASPWYTSQTRTIALEKNNEFIFTSKLADSLIKKEVSRFQEEHMEKYATLGKEMRLIEFKNMKTSLNGYVMENPLDKRAKKLEMVFFLSMSPEYILRKMEEIIGRHLRLRDIVFSSFVFASFTVSRDMFIQRENFMLIDIGSEVTDISMIKKEILKEAISFPYGKNFILRKLTDILGKTPDQAESLFALYKENHAEKKLSDNIDKALAVIGAEWLKKFQEALVKLSNDISIPSTIFLTTDDDVADWFVETIKNEQFNQYTLTESKFKLIIINAAMLHGIAIFKEAVARDRFIIIEAIYIDRFLQ